MIIGIIAIIRYYNYWNNCTVWIAAMSANDGRQTLAVDSPEPEPLRLASYFTTCHITKIELPLNKIPNTNPYLK